MNGAINAGYCNYIQCQFADRDKMPFTRIL